MKKLRLGILASGSGTNLQALLEACALPGYPAEVAVVLSDLPTAFALERARNAGVPAVGLEASSFSSREAFESQAVEALQSHGVELVCLAGFMRLLGTGFLRAFPDRVVNIHPALLPAFPGLHAHRQTLRHGAKISGCTVHFVDEGTDTGPILVQAAVPVLPDDDEKSLAARILIEEHRAYPLAVRLIAEGRVSVRGRTVHVLAEPLVLSQAIHNPGRPIG